MSGDRLKAFLRWCQEALVSPPHMFLVEDSLLCMVRVFIPERARVFLMQVTGVYKVLCEVFGRVSRDALRDKISLVYGPLVQSKPFVSLSIVAAPASSSLFTVLVGCVRVCRRLRRADCCAS